MFFVCHSAICIIIFTKYSNLLLDNINIFYYIIDVNLKRGNKDETSNFCT